MVKLIASMMPLEPQQGLQNFEPSALPSDIPSGLTLITSVSKGVSQWSPRVCSHDGLRNGGYRRIEVKQGTLRKHFLAQHEVGPRGHGGQVGIQS
jgi:hypothetical protein